MRKVFIALKILLVVSLLSIISIVSGQEPLHESMCQGKYKRLKPTDTELDEVLKNHLQWLGAYYNSYNGLKSKKASNDLRRANLCGADLSERNLAGVTLTGANLLGINLEKANLVGADLRWADIRGALLMRINLHGANLQFADLSHSILDWADLREVDLWRANLSPTRLEKVNFSKARLGEANLTDAYIGYANLTDAVLNNANLKNVDFSHAVLSNARFSGADLKEVLYDPDPGSLPNIESFIHAKNISQMKYRSSPWPLIKLRKALREAGAREKEREITYVINHWGMLNNALRGLTGNVEYLFNYLLFDLTTKWGMSPNRALRLLGLVIILWTLPYIVAIRGNGPGGIYIVWSESRIRRDLGQDEPLRLRTGWIKSIWFGFYFSVLSAFNIGWRDLNIGNWIARIQAREYTFRADGWVRTISGIESLISVYFLAIWALTYFGRPFE